MKVKSELTELTRGWAVITLRNDKRKECRIVNKVSARMHSECEKLLTADGITSSQFLISFELTDQKKRVRGSRQRECRYRDAQAIKSRLILPRLPYLLFRNHTRRCCRFDFAKAKCASCAERFIVTIICDTKPSSWWVNEAPLKIQNL